jgi:hypothetical protein
VGASSDGERSSTLAQSSATLPMPQTATLSTCGIVIIASQPASQSASQPDGHHHQHPPRVARGGTTIGKHQQARA